MAKGAGMLAPGLATMLVRPHHRRRRRPRRTPTAPCARRPRVTFDRVDSDGCMSTNDTVLLLASGASGVDARPRRLRRGAHRGRAHDLARAAGRRRRGRHHDIAVTVHRRGQRGRRAVAVARAVARSQPVQDRRLRHRPQLGPGARRRRHRARAGRRVRPRRARRVDQRRPGLPGRRRRRDRASSSTSPPRARCASTIDLHAGDAHRRPSGPTTSRTPTSTRTPRTPHERTAAASGPPRPDDFVFDTRTDLRPDQKAEVLVEALPWLRAVLTARSSSSSTAATP